MQKFIRTALNQNNLELNHLFVLWDEVQNHKFLFGVDVATYIDEVYKNGNLLWAVKQTLLTGGQKNIEKHTELLTWFDEQRTTANDKFLKYMDFRKP